ncbi:SAM hydrolase/SAM-dependent halogenase family protein [Fructilactobacillus sp. Tb1]|uniref:SAM hydrolase/SAM-dependent halogenase family protein n=1 Tax=Fructilactobacillus sp. Tb1 TaxID=3422304 RepID=UPI003D2E5DDE
MVAKHSLVLQTDFGLDDGAVSAMYGVAKTINQDLDIYDLTHNIPQYDIWTASYRLYQTVKYWPAGTVFVSVVDPGVGSNRKSIAVKTKTGQYIITPDNGTITHIAQYVGIESVKEIDEATDRLPGSEKSNTFHGRDVYVYNGAKLATDNTHFDNYQNELDVDAVRKLNIFPPVNREDEVSGTIDVLDIRYGSVWTNIPFSFFEKDDIKYGDIFDVVISHRGTPVFEKNIKFVKTFADVALGEPLIYINSLVNIGIALNQKSFADTFDLGIGNDWKVDLRKVKGE